MDLGLLVLVAPTCALKQAQKQVTRPSYEDGSDG